MRTSSQEEGHLYVSLASRALRVMTVHSLAPKKCNISISRGSPIQPPLGTERRPFFLKLHTRLQKCMSSSSNTYPPPPPPPPRRSQPESSSTLYDASPHNRRDSLLRRRNHSTSHTDPFHVVVFILLLGLFFTWKPNFIPFSSSLGITSSSPPSSKHCNCQSAQQSLQQQPNMVWQKTFTLPSASRGCHLITREVEREISEGLKGCKAGILTLFIQHTSAALTINENYDPDVRKDMDMAMDKVISESLPWKHVDEGPDDSASHTKASLFGPTVTIPITDGRMNLGTWQGVMLCEWRAAKHSRRIVATILP